MAWAGAVAEKITALAPIRAMAINFRMAGFLSLVGPG